MALPVNRNRGPRLNLFDDTEYRCAEPVWPYSGRQSNGRADVAVGPRASAGGGRSNPEVRAVEARNHSPGAAFPLGRGGLSSGGIARGDRARSRRRPDGRHRSVWRRRQSAGQPRRGPRPSLARRRRQPGRSIPSCRPHAPRRRSRTRPGAGSRRQPLGPDQPAGPLAHRDLRSAARMHAWCRTGLPLT